MNGLDWLAHYEANVFPNVQGWVARPALALLGLADAVTREFGGHGGALEIGVHKGLFFTAMNGLVADASTPSLAIDLFGDQGLNIDGSGSGDEAVFRDNLARFDRHGGANVVVLAGDSTRLTPAAVLDHLRVRPRLLSVDGGHTTEHTIHDLRLCAEVMEDRGIVFVDDILNAHWLGVVEGVLHYLRERPILWPLAIGHNKLLMCGMSWHDRFFARFEQSGVFHKRVRLGTYHLWAV